MVRGGLRQRGLAGNRTRPPFHDAADLTVWLPFRAAGPLCSSITAGAATGPAGGGDGPAAPALLPAPRDLTSASYSDRRLSDVLWHGVPGSSMPGWNELSRADLRALVTYVRSLTTVSIRRTRQDRRAHLPGR